MTHLFDHICWASENLTRVETDLVVVYEEKSDEPVRILVPAPEWMAMALVGGLLPPVEHYHNEARDGAGNFIGPRDYWSNYEPIGPLTEEQAIEYLIQKDVPRHIWDTPGMNYQRFWICRRSQIPSSRRFRNAWRIAT